MLTPIQKGELNATAVTDIQITPAEFPVKKIQITPAKIPLQNPDYTCKNSFKKSRLHLQNSLFKNPNYTCRFPFKNR